MVNREDILTLWSLFSYYILLYLKYYYILNIYINYYILLYKCIYINIIKIKIKIRGINKRIKGERNKEIKE